MSRWQNTFPWTASAIGILRPEGHLRRRRWIRIAGAVLVLVAAHALLTAFMAAKTARVADRFVARWGALDPASHSPAAVEDAANKARAVRAAIDLMVLPRVRAGEASGMYEEFASNFEKTFTAADREAIAKVVAGNASVLPILDVAAARPAANWDLHYDRGFEVEVPPLLQLLHLVKMNAAAGRLAIEDGRVDDAVTAVRRGSAVAESLEHEPILIVQLIRLAVERLDAGLTRRILQSPALRPEQLAALQKACARSDPRRGMQQAMIVEANRAPSPKSFQVAQQILLAAQVPPSAAPMPGGGTAPGTPGEPPPSPVGVPAEDAHPDWQLASKVAQRSRDIGGG